MQLIPHYENFIFNKDIFERLFNSSVSNKSSYGERMRKHLSDKDYQEMKKLFEENLAGVRTTWLSTYALFTIDIKCE